MKAVGLRYHMAHFIVEPLHGGVADPAAGPIGADAVQGATGRSPLLFPPRSTACDCHLSPCSAVRFFRRLI